ncbi:MAG: DUF692 domain-containing protein [Pseudomonadota bacterium]|nr:DUF692 domain-containing protein [Pseudomonadota bacterium]
MRRPEAGGAAATSRSHRVGIGWRQPHYRELIEQRPDLGFIEVHSENFFFAGGPALQALERARATYPVSLHGVGLALGSNAAPEPRHWRQLALLVERVDPWLVSEHLCWGAAEGRHFNDLLPLPYDPATLSHFAARVDALQTMLKRVVLIENVSAYFAFRADEMTETAFLAELSRRTGCGILLDLNNLYVNAVNFGFDPHLRLAELPPDAIGEFHLAGHSAAADCLIDTHATRVSEPVWALHAAATQRYGPRPTLIEWDADLPPLATLLDEVARARAHLPSP